MLTAHVLDVTSLHHRRAAHRWDRTAVADMVERVTWSFPDRLALVGADGAYAEPAYSRVTYREADETANRIAHALAARGLTKGDVVALLCENSVEALLMKLGVAKAGLTVAPLNPSLAPDVVTDILRRIEPGLVVVDAEVWPRLAGAVEDAGLRAGVTIEIGGSAVDGSVSFADLIAGQPTTEPEVEIHGDDIWELLFTSGTTAMPKAVMLSHTTGTLGGHGFALSLTRGLRIEDELVLCSFLPLIYHVGDNPFALGTFAAAGTLVIGRKPEPRQRRRHRRGRAGDGPVGRLTATAAGRGRGARRRAGDPRRPQPAGDRLRVGSTAPRHPRHPATGVRERISWSSGSSGRPNRSPATGSGRPGGTTPTGGRHLGTTTWACRARCSPRRSPTPKGRPWRDHPASPGRPCTAHR